MFLTSLLLSSLPLSSPVTVKHGSSGNLDAREADGGGPREVNQLTPIEALVMRGPSRMTTLTIKGLLEQSSNDLLMRLDPETPDPVIKGLGSGLGGASQNLTPFELCPFPGFMPKVGLIKVIFKESLERLKGLLRPGAEWNPNSFRVSGQDGIYLGLLYGTQRRVATAGQTQASTDEKHVLISVKALQILFNAENRKVVKKILALDMITKPHQERFFEALLHLRRVIDQIHKACGPVKPNEGTYPMLPFQGTLDSLSLFYRFVDSFHHKLHSLHDMGTQPTRKSEFLMGMQTIMQRRCVLTFIVEIKRAVNLVKNVLNSVMLLSKVEEVLTYQSFSGNAKHVPALLREHLTDFEPGKDVAKGVVITLEYHPDMIDFGYQNDERRMDPYVVLSPEYVIDPFGFWGTTDLRLKLLVSLLGPARGVKTVVDEIVEGSTKDLENPDHEEQARKMVVEPFHDLANQWLENVKDGDAAGAEGIYVTPKGSLAHWVQVVTKMIEILAEPFGFIEPSFGNRDIFLPDDRHKISILYSKINSPAGQPNMNPNFLDRVWVKRLSQWLKRVKHIIENQIPGKTDNAKIGSSSAKDPNARALQVYSYLIEDIDFLVQRDIPDQDKPAVLSPVHAMRVGVNVALTCRLTGKLLSTKEVGPLNIRLALSIVTFGDFLIKNSHQLTDPSGIKAVKDNFVKFCEFCNQAIELMEDDIVEKEPFEVLKAHVQPLLNEVDFRDRLSKVTAAAEAFLLFAQSEGVRKAKGGKYATVTVPKMQMISPLLEGRQEQPASVSPAANLNNVPRPRGGAPSPSFVSSQGSRELASTAPKIDSMAQVEVPSPSAAAGRSTLAADLPISRDPSTSSTDRRSPKASTGSSSRVAPAASSSNSKPSSESKGGGLGWILGGFRRTRGRS